MDPSGLSDEVENLSLTTRVLVQASNLVGLGVQLGCYLETAAAALDVYAHFSLLGATGVALNWVACSATGEGELPIDPVEEPPIEPAPDEPTSCSFCFAAGTPIHTDHGDVPVEEIKVGDEVESRNSATGKLELEPVTELTPLHKDSLLEIRVEGERSPLRPSTRHPFWVRRGDSADGAWVESGKMKVGDLLQTVDGNWRRVTAITPLPGQETVYNFTVANDHDYFVGETGFLVHNANCNCDKHHIIPKFLGGDPDGPTALIPRDFHQNVITPAFRAAAGAFEYGYNYGRGRVLTPDELKQILRNVYRENPLSDAIKECLE